MNPDRILRLYCNTEILLELKQSQVNSVRLNNFVGFKHKPPKSGRHFTDNFIGLKNKPCKTFGKFIGLKHPARHLKHYMTHNKPAKCQQDMTTYVGFFGKLAKPTRQLTSLLDLNTNQHQILCWTYWPTSKMSARHDYFVEFFGKLAKPARQYGILYCTDFYNKCVTVSPKSSLIY